MEKEITILIADDHYLIAKLIKMMLIGFNDKFKVKIEFISRSKFAILKLLFISSLTNEIQIKQFLIKKVVINRPKLISLFVDSDLLDYCKVKVYDN